MTSIDNLNDLYKSNISFFSYGRFALYSFLCYLKAISNKNTILLPLFQCDEVKDAIYRAGYKVIFYKINIDLSINIDDITSKLNSDINSILIVNYFGFPQRNINIIRNLCKLDNIILIEDNAMVFYDHQAIVKNLYSDIHLYSFRKTFPIPVGAALYFKDSKMKEDFETWQKNNMLLKSFSKINIKATFKVFREFNLLFIKRYKRISLSKKYIPQDFDNCGNKFNKFVLLLFNEKIVSIVKRHRQIDFQILEMRLKQAYGITPLLSINDNIFPHAFVFVSSNPEIYELLSKRKFRIDYWPKIDDLLSLEDFSVEKKLNKELMVIYLGH